MRVSSWISWFVCVFLLFVWLGYWHTFVPPSLLFIVKNTLSEDSFFSSDESKTSAKPVKVKPVKVIAPKRRILRSVPFRRSRGFHDTSSVVATGSLTELEITARTVSRYPEPVQDPEHLFLLRGDICAYRDEVNLNVPNRLAYGWWNTGIDWVKVKKEGDKSSIPGVLRENSRYANTTDRITVFAMDLPSASDARERPAVPSKPVEEFLVHIPSYGPSKVLRVVDTFAEADVSEINADVSEIKEEGRAGGLLGGESSVRKPKSENDF